MANESRLWVPSHLRPAVQRTKIVFYRWTKGGVTRYTVGAPEQFPAPQGAEKIVCESAAEVEKYSNIIRQQDQDDLEMSEAERYEREEPIWQALRADLVQKMANAKNQINRDFCREALRRMDEMEAKRKEKRESYMHIEAHEQGK
ncbi:MAG TPA: hypothetical protein VIY48_03000 [Candidatus Paceibacterota bacterium]